MAIPYIFALLASGIFNHSRLKSPGANTLQIFKIMEYRYGYKTTIIASQLEPAEWHNNFGASQLADSILDRIVSNSYKIILSGDSLRPKKIEDWLCLRASGYPMPSFGTIFCDFSGSDTPISVAQSWPTRLALTERRIHAHQPLRIQARLSPLFLGFNGFLRRDLSGVWVREVTKRRLISFRNSRIIIGKVLYN